MITTPDNIERAKQVSNLLQEYDVSFTNDEDSLPFHIGDNEGRGRGIVARRPLDRGDPIMAHTPVLLVHRAFRDDLAQDTQEALLQFAVDSLPDQTSEPLRDPMSRIPQQRLIRAISTTNAFHVDMGGEDGHHYGVFPETARLTHDCRPNTVFYIDPTTLMHVTTAVRPITRGEELTVSHFDPLASLADRQDHAQLAWGSDCQCIHCALSSGEAAESDTRLREIRWIEGQLEDPKNAQDISVGLITYLLKLYEDEGLQCCMAGAYTLASLSLKSLGYDKRALKYAELAIEALGIEEGDGAPDVRTMRELIRDPTGHFTFPDRVKKGRK